MSTPDPLPGSGPPLPGPRDELWQPHWVEGLARTLVGSRARAADLAQEAWFIADRSGATQPERGPLLAILRNLDRNHRRQEERRRLREGRAHAPEATPGADQLLERAEAKQRIGHAVLALKEPLRATVLLRFFEGRSVGQIAELQSCPEDTVRARLRRAYGKLKRDLGRDGEDWTRYCLLALPPGTRLAPLVSTSLTASAVAGFSALVMALAWIGWLGIVPAESQDANPGELAALTQPSTDLAPVKQAPRPVSAEQRARVSSSLASDRSTLQGVVRDDRGRPVAKAWIAIIPQDTAWDSDPLPLDAVFFEQTPVHRNGMPPANRQVARTDAQGRFDLGALPTGWYACSVRATGFQPWDQAWLFHGANAAPPLESVELQPSPRWKLTFRNARGEPVPEVEVLRIVGADDCRFLHSTHLSARNRARYDRRTVHLGRSDARGVLELDSLPVGSLQLAARSARHPLEILDPMHASENQDREWVQVLRTGLPVRGRVVLPEGADADLLSVWVMDASGTRKKHKATCSADGSFDLASACAEDGQPVTRLRVLAGGATRYFNWASEVQAIARNGGDVQLQLDRMAKAELRCLDELSGLPLRDVSVEYRFVQGGESRNSGRALWAIPGEDGFLRVGVPYPRDSGELHLTVLAPGYAPLSVGPLGLEGTNRFDRLTLRAKARLEVHALEASTGLPVDGARIALQWRAGALGPGYRTYHDEATSEDGSVRFEVPDNARAIVTAWAPGYAPAAPVIWTDTSGGTPSITLHLDPGAQLTARAIDPQGHPIVGATMALRCEPEAELREALPTTRYLGRDALNQTLRTGPAGSATFRGLPPGVHRLATRGASRFAEESDWIEVEVQAGEHREVDVPTPARSRLSGTVRSLGQGVPGARLTLIPGGHELRTWGTANWGSSLAGLGAGSRTGADGCFHFTDVEPGSYVLQVDHSGHALFEEFPVEVAGPESQVMVDLGDGSLAGQLRNELGAPCTEALALIAYESDAQHAARALENYLRGDFAALHELRVRPARATPEGSFELHGVPAGKALALITGQRGCEVSIRSVTLEPGEAKDLGSLELTP